MQQNHEVNVAQTYLGLRLAMILLVALLFLSIFVEYFFSGGPLCLQSSISAYYYTAVRPVFIGALCAVGAGLIVYKGSTDIENVLLDFSGFVAFLVAFVPIDWDEKACDASSRPVDEEIRSAIENNTISLFIIGAMAIAVSRKYVRGRYTNNGQVSKPAKWTIGASAAALAAGVIFYLVASPETFSSWGHNIAAGTLFAGFLGTIVENARNAAQPHKRRYYAVAAGTLAAAIGFILAGRWIEGFDVWLFWAETAGIAGFAVFWIIQTVELRGDAARTFVDSSTRE